MSTLGKQSPRHESELRFQRILVAVDGSEGSARASEVAVDLAKKFNAQLFVLNVFRGYPEYVTMFPSVPAPSERPSRLTRRMQERLLRKL